jgi:hypothetical protein
MLVEINAGATWTGARGVVGGPGMDMVDVNEGDGSRLCPDRSKSRRDCFGTIVDAGFLMAIEVIQQQ